MPPVFWGGGHLLCIQAPPAEPERLSAGGKEAAPLCFLPFPPPSAPTPRYAAPWVLTVLRQQCHETGMGVP